MARHRQGRGEPPAGALESQGEGRYRLRGELSFANAAALERTGRVMFDDAAGQLVVDLAAVTRADSAGLALLIEWLREARAAGKRITFSHIPEQMLAIARVSSLEQLLPLATEETTPDT